ncbi:MAG: ABC transporter ATP-binding protein [Bacteroidales bacterium]|nr:MAG: ABC transporter ATP-binding protein [Bacteroidales bacterium]
MKRFFKVFRFVYPYKWYAIANIICNILGSIFGLFSLVAMIPFLQILFKTADFVSTQPDLSTSFISNIKHSFNSLITSIITDYGATYALMFIITLVIVGSLLKNLFIYFSLWFLSPVRTGVVMDIRNELFRKIMILPLSYFSDEKKGDIISKMTNDVNEVEVSIVRSLEMFFRDPITIIVYLVSLILMSPGLTLFVFILLPISGFIIGRIGRNLRKSSFKGQKRMGNLLSILEEALGGLRIIKAFNAEEKVTRKFESTNSFYSLLMIKMSRRRDLASPVSEFLGTIVVALVLWYGGTMIINGTGSLNGAGLIVYVGMFYMIINPAKSFSTAYFNIIKGLASADRIETILGAETMISNKVDAKAISIFNSSIEYRNVSFKYENDYVLKNINLKIEKGKTIALVGQSGSGKSTFVDLLPRFYDLEEGEILIDGLNIKDFTLESLRAMMGNVNQEPILFNDTFYNNIAFGLESATMDDVISAAKIANAHDFIAASTNGYYTNIGDRGNKMSGGQRQRVSIARAMVKNPPIMILDEATSALDTESEKLVQDAIENLMLHRTSVVIAHRLSTVRNADLICVFHEGEIVERGKHEELIALNGIYTKLYNLQTL